MAIAAIKGDKTLAELSQQFDVHPNQIMAWKTQLLEGAAPIFGSARGAGEPAVDIKKLHTKIGELTGSHPAGGQPRLTAKLRPATRYDETARNFLAAVYPVASIVWRN